MSVTFYASFQGEASFASSLADINTNLPPDLNIIPYISGLKETDGKVLPPPHISAVSVELDYLRINALRGLMKLFSQSVPQVIGITLTTRITEHSCELILTPDYNSMAVLTALQLRLRRTLRLPETLSCVLPHISLGKVEPYDDPDILNSLIGVRTVLFNIVSCYISVWSIQNPKRIYHEEFLFNYKKELPHIRRNHHCIHLRIRYPLFNSFSTFIYSGPCC